MRTLPIVASSLLFCCVFMFVCCQNDQELMGRYEATNPSNESSPVILVLDAGGKGSWTVNEEDVLIKWEIRKGEIWLHSKSGGVFTGKINPDGSIYMILPGAGEFLFKK